ncbi:MAG TPA: NUDIX domain-containing protein [Anaerolineae bacterium]|nr:NUDIX domain-containing protein [Anaerolineae bacterium]
MTDYIQWLRSNIGHHKTILAYTTAIIRDDRGRVLCQRRRDFRDAWWGLPGGALEIGETFSACAKREAFEETGLRIKPIKLIGLYASPEWDVTYPNGDQVQQFTIALDCRIVAGELKSDSDEVIHQEFFALHAVPSLPPWYAAMLGHLDRREAYFDPPIIGSPVESYMQMIRHFVGASTVLVAGASAAIFDDRQRVLLGLRGDNHLWGMPAGQMELGETPAGTVMREALEEVGLRIRVTQLISVQTGPDAIHAYPDGNQVQVVGARFRAEIIEGDLKPDGTETLAVDWFDVNDLPPTLPRHEKIICLAIDHPEGGQFS